MSTWAIGEPLGAVMVVLLGGLAPLLLLPLATLALGEPAARALRPGVAIVEAIAGGLETFARWCLLLLALGMLVTVGLRYVFGESFTRLNEAVMYAHALAFLMAAPAALMRDAHVLVDDATVTSHIKRIRRKFVAVDAAFDEIDTVHGAGYRWRA